MGLFKTYSEKEVKRVRPIVEKINSLEPAMKELSDSELVAKTPYFKEQLKNGKTLDDILPEAFAPKVTDVVAKAVMDLIK